MALWWADSPAEEEEAIVTFPTTPEAWTPWFLRSWPERLRLDGADVAQLVGSGRPALRILRSGELSTAEHATWRKYMGGMVALDVRDDGAGFDPVREFGRTRRDRDSGGFGLKGMCERVEGVGGC
jgi:hypothetical protein